MGSTYYVTWIGVALLTIPAVWFLTRQLESTQGKRLLRCVCVATVGTPLPLWVPGEGGFIIPAGLALINRSDPWLTYAMLGAVPIAFMTMLLYSLWALGARMREYLSHRKT